jgi:hypothetical protein
VYGLDVRGLDDVAELDADVAGDDLITVRVTRHDGPRVPLHRLDAERVVEAMGEADQWVLERRTPTPT